jgi:ParB family transcriptional regulator, chromosome partitioning protein
LPAAEQLWTWCLQRSQDHLLDILALLAAATVDAMQRKTGERRPGLAHAAELANALSLGMRTWFVPGAEN